MSEISLIIPLYNAEKYLRACLDSVAGQTFRDFEVVLVNDGSTDTTEEIAGEYVAQYPYFRLINQKNAGVSAARNAGINNSDSPFFAFLDQDDVLHPQALEVLWTIIKKSNADVAAFGVQTVPEDFRLSAKEPRVDMQNILYELAEHPSDYFFRNPRGRSILIWNKLYRRSAMAGVFFPLGVQPAEDTVFTMKTIFNVRNIAMTETPFLYYRQSDTSVMKQGITEKYIRAHAAAAEEMFDYFFCKGHLSDKDKRRMQFYLSRFVFKSLVSQPLRLTGSGEASVQKLELSRGFVEKLVLQKAVLFELLGWRKAIASRLFMARKYGLAKFLV